MPLTGCIKRRAECFELAAPPYKNLRFLSHQMP